MADASRRPARLPPSSTRRLTMPCGSGRSRSRLALAVVARLREAPRPPHRRQVMAVQPLEVRRVDAVLHDLQPVARDERAADVAQHTLPDEEIVARQQRRRLGAQVGEDQAAQLLRAVGRRASAREPLGRGRPHRDLEAASRGRELPAVVGAADAVRLDAAVAKRRAPVRAVLLEHAERAALRAERDEIFAEQPHGKDAPRRQLRAGRDRQPVAAQQSAHRRSGPDARQPLLLLGRHPHRRRRSPPP